MEIIIDNLISNKELSFLIFSVLNMWHKQLKKCNKYKLVIFLDERRFSFANFLHHFIQVTSLTHSAFGFGTTWALREDYLGTTWRQLGDHQLNTFLLPEEVLWTIWGLLGDHYETNGRLLSDYWANNILFCNCTYISYIKCILVRIYFSFVGFCQNVSENFDEECWANKRHKECTTSPKLDNR